MFGENYRNREGCEHLFTVDPRPIKVGPGAVRELGADAAALGMRRAAVFTDSTVMKLEPCSHALESLRNAGVEFEVYDLTRVEPTDASFVAAGEFMKSCGADGVVSIGGGSVIDTGKAASLLATYPADFLDYVNKPIGAGKAVPGPLPPHIACPTTSGTGSESTAVAVFDLEAQQVKTGISSRYMKPSLGIIDPEFTYSLPPLVTAATAFDVLTHAAESYTAIPFTSRPAPEDPAARPPYQGANPYSDAGSLEAIRLAGRYLIRAVSDASDHEARNAMMYAATMAGISFGNAGVHIPHAMSYSVAGMIRDYQPEGWPRDHAMCPHGISVVVNAPAAFRFTGASSPQRHLRVLECLGGDIADIDATDAGKALADRFIEMMRATGIPNGLSELGYGESDIPALVDGAHRQQRLLTLAPRSVEKRDLEQLYRDAMRYW
ncbi:MAG TPA: hydroxyacid-oxoacid transhydrogenase [Arenicellales bacterium]|nr:hydroxyacid-oxoacid transhydrogenase [Arenicellales bacterium]